MKYIYLYIIAFLCVFITFNRAIAQSRAFNLNAVQYKNSVKLSFTISVENYCVGYSILRSEDGRDFYSIYSYPSVCGDKEKTQSVVYYDNNPLKNITSYYQVYIPPSSYSEIVSVNYLESSEYGYILFSNPINDVLKINTGSKYTPVEIYDIKGNKTLELKADEEGYINENTNELPNGIYFFIIKANDDAILKGKFLKQE